MLMLQYPIYLLQNIGLHSGLSFIYSLEQIHLVLCVPSDAPHTPFKSKQVTFVRNPSLLILSQSIGVIVESQQLFEVVGHKSQGRRLGEDFRGIGVNPCSVVSRVARLPFFNDTKANFL